MLLHDGTVHCTVEWPCPRRGFLECWHAVQPCRVENVSSAILRAVGVSLSGGIGPLLSTVCVSRLVMHIGIRYAQRYGGALHSHASRLTSLQKSHSARCHARGGVG